MFTIKLKIKSVEGDLEPYFKEYGKLKRICYNKFVDGEKLSPIIKNLSSQIKTFFDRSFIGWVGMDAQQIYTSQKELKIPKIVFGGKHNLQKLINKKITRDEWRQLRNPYIYCLGSSFDSNGNRKVKSDVKNNLFYFCPCRNEKFKIEIENHTSYNELLLKIEEFSNIGKCPITYRITRTHLLLMIDESRLQELKQVITRIDNRIFSIDLNPNSIGIVVCDYNDKNEQKIIHKQIFDLTNLNLQKNNHKTKHELYQVCHSVLTLMNHYKASSCCIEKLEVKSENHKRGKTFNRTINNIWKRKLIYNSLSKLCNLNRINFVPLATIYSSLIGCINNQKDIDSIAAALEMGRRGNLYVRMYIYKNLTKDKVIYPKFDKNQLIRWKDEIGSNQINNWKELYQWFKENPTFSYRILLSDFKKSHVLFRFKSRQSNVCLCLY